jgi:hypothetical protein
MKEPIIEINGYMVTPAMSMTIRVALENFAMDLHANGLGDDDSGQAMKDSYIQRIVEIRELMFER